MGTASITLADGKKTTLTDIKGQDVKGFDFCVNTNCLSYEFPTKYNRGTINGTVPQPGATSNIKIKMSKGQDANSAYIDYLFPIAELGTKGGTWWAYDPKVKGTTSSATPPSPTPSPTPA